MFPPCTSVTNADNLWYITYTFDNTWNNSQTILVADTFNTGPMQGTWSLVLNFCDSVSLIQGNVSSTTPGNQLGWNYGFLFNFTEDDINPPAHPTVPPSELALLEFIQTYSFGDVGPPCSSPRTSTVNIYCGGGKANCTQVPGSAGADCLTKSNNPYCICSVTWNETFGFCSGLQVNLLSNSCPKNASHWPITPVYPPMNNPGTVAGIFFAVVFVLLFVTCGGGYIYNYSVHAKRGCEAMPFYDTCYGSAPAPVYASSSTPASSSYDRSGYGSL